MTNSMANEISMPDEIDLTDAAARPQGFAKEPGDDLMCDIAEPSTDAGEPAIGTAGHLIGDEITLVAALEALLLVADQPVDPTELASFLDRPVHVIEDALADLAADYVTARRGFELKQVEGRWRFYTARHVAAVIELQVTDRRQGRLSRAALETLAVVAYRQPVSRARVGSIRGVNVDAVMRTLVGRGLVAEAATDPETGAVLFGTTGYFLERLGIASIAELPPVADYLPEGSVLDELIDPTG